MKTEHSVSLLPETGDRCWALLAEGCSVLTKISKGCGSCACPFYKPMDCGDWIRVEDEEGISIVPQEEYYPAIREIADNAKPAVWKITRVRS